MKPHSDGGFSEKCKHCGDQQGIWSRAELFTCRTCGQSYQIENVPEIEKRISRYIRLRLKRSTTKSSIIWSCLGYDKRVGRDTYVLLNGDTAELYVWTTADSWAETRGWIKSRLKWLGV